MRPNNAENNNVLQKFMEGLIMSDKIKLQKVQQVARMMHGWSLRLDCLLEELSRSDELNEWEKEKFDRMYSDLDTSFFKEIFYEVQEILKDMEESK